MKTKEIEVAENKLFDPEAYADLFCRLVQAGIDRWVEAGKVLVTSEQKDPTIFGKIIARSPYLTRDILLAFKRIGEKRLYPYILLDSSPASKRLALLPYDEQERLYGKPVRVVYQNIDGKFESFESSPNRLSKQEAELVFSPKGMRSVTEQEEILKTRLSQAPTQAPTQGKYIEPGIDEAKRNLQLAYGLLVDAKNALERSDKPMKHGEFNSIDSVLKVISEMRKKL